MIVAWIKPRVMIVVNTVMNLYEFRERWVIS
jgi:hypothetical protein